MDYTEITHLVSCNWAIKESQALIVILSSLVYK